MHFCYLTFGEATSPAYFRAIGMGAALIRLGHRVSYIVDDMEVNFKSGLFDPKAEVVFLKRGRTWRQYPGRRRAIRKLKPDYVVMISPSPKGFLATALRPGQKIVAEWDEPAFTKPFKFPKKQMSLFLDRWLRRRADVVTVCTKYLQEYFEKEHGIKADYLPHAVYLPKYEEPASPFKRPTLVYLGNLFDLWDHDIIFEGLKLLAGRGVKPAVMVMGDGPDRAKWEGFVKREGLDNVEMAGFVGGKEMWARLRHARALLFPIRDTVVNRSRCPSKTFAYAQAKRPVITSWVGEVAMIFGERGTYVESTPEGFAGAMERAAGGGEPADVDYGVERHTYDVRAPMFLEAVRKGRQRG